MTAFISDIAQRPRFLRVLLQELWACLIWHRLVLPISCFAPDQVVQIEALVVSVPRVLPIGLATPRREKVEWRMSIIKESGGDIRACLETCHSHELARRCVIMTHAPEHPNGVLIKGPRSFSCGKLSSLGRRGVEVRAMSDNDQGQAGEGAQHGFDDATGALC
eukprot:CAMPEP_0177340372 /NCGR_PEP_ID=MMETSP0368-20130122/25919_1 /TAXON_ID=447022 ORGANISM="Scrippsiella hangoei-like, Strain SHHI-4" /NCGR_SAMPLE_ID=MMETSP0368 /ASSEMBLY_ACC=CAM_ASM_000363 /LENGTH=162 /DNA_ID=CAMNT_0018801557 /DNA_START=28 /DNA_END=513 /DNA_ORIENTATION=-